MKLFNKNEAITETVPKIKKTPKVYTRKQIAKTIGLIVVTAIISSLSTLYISGLVGNYVRNEVKAQVTEQVQSLTQK